jgi:hypothetical protein
VPTLAEAGALLYHMRMSLPAQGESRVLSGIQSSGEPPIGNWRGLAVAGALAASLACTRPAPEATPEGAVRAFLDVMEGAGDDPSLTHRAYDLLGPQARANLGERAHRTSQLQGRQVEPWTMLAAGLFGVSFRPKATRATVVGDRATVDVFGEDPQSEHASVLCVHESEGWRIEPGLPEP